MSPINILITLGAQHMQANHIHQTFNQPYSNNAKATSFDLGLSWGGAATFVASCLGIAGSAVCGALPLTLTFGAAATASVLSAASGFAYSHKKMHDAKPAPMQTAHTSRIAPAYVVRGIAVPVLASLAVGCAAHFWAASKYPDAPEVPVSNAPLVMQRTSGSSFPHMG